MTDVLECQLQVIHKENLPDPVFADQLEQELRRMHASITSSVRPIPPRKVTMTRRIAAIAASVFIILGLFTIVPPLRSIAQDILAELFPTTEQDQITITYNDPITPQEFQSDDTFREAVPFTITMPNALPSGPIDMMYTYFPGRNVATQQYATSNLDIWVSQQPIVDVQSNGLLVFSFDLTLPEDVEPQFVALGNTQAELIRGMWVESGEVDAAGNTLYRWSNNFWYFSLRWQDDVFIYEVAIMPSSRTTADEIEMILLDIARSMVPN